MKPDQLKCSRPFREAILSACPALHKSRALRRLFAYLAFGTWRCHYTNNLMIPADVLAHLQEKEYLLEHGNYVGQQFLDEFSDQVAPINCNNSVWMAGLCRTVASVEWPDLVRRAIWVERQKRHDPYAHKDNADDRVFFSDGRRVTAYSLRTERDNLREEALKSIVRAGCTDAKRLLAYLNNKKSNRFTKLLANMDQAVAAAQQIPNERAREHALDTLSAICEQPLPLYQASPRGRTVRIFPLNSSLLTLKSSVRRVLTYDWIDLDLRSAQAAIVARDWQIASLQSFLESGKPLWTYLMEQIGISGECYDTFKPMLKDALYATIFGANERNICWHLSHTAKENGVGRRFLDLPLMQDILTARQRRMAAVVEASGAADTYDRWVSLPQGCSPEKGVRSVIAQCAQAAEMRLLAPAIDLAIEWQGKSSGFEIILWQHDGFSFMPDKHEDRQQWVKRLQRVVQAQADHLSYVTRLEAV